MVNLEDSVVVALCFFFSFFYPYSIILLCSSVAWQQETALNTEKNSLKPAWLGLSAHG